MTRKNTVTWVDGRVLTKLMGELQRELMEWQVHAYDAIESDKQTFGGDRSVIVSAIYLRDALNKVIDKSKQRNDTNG